ncbi:MAG: magnesium ion transporter [Claussenomyces sp. TS43310]|nr:MAG: magnesium ion transporter [Claussenomyces sp. TS43310]
MRPKLAVAAPSSTLLNFLRYQSEGPCFFSANPRNGAFTFDHAAPKACQPRSQQPVELSKPTARKISSSARGLTSLEAGFLNLDFLWPRAAKGYIPQLQAQTRRDGRCYAMRRADDTFQSQRHASSDVGWWSRRLRPQKKQRQPALKPEDLPLGFNFRGEEGAESMFSLGRTVSGKAANELKLRCTEFDENGNVVLVNGEFKKSELIAKYGLLPRDLRKIDSSILPHILVRPSAILINLLHLRCLIKSDRVLVFDVYGSTDSYTQSVFMYDLEGKLRQKQNSPSAGGLPYEFRALEAVLISVTSGLEGEFEGVREPVVSVLRELEEDIDRDKLRQLLIYSKKLGTFEQKAKLVRDAIDELLEADDDLAAMYLTEKSHDLTRGEDDHTEVEMLLEAYHKICDEIVQASGNLVSNIRNTEEIVKAILDANRNSLMLLDLKFSIGTLSLSSAGFIAALYGMNLKNFLEETDFGFGGMSGLCAILGTIVCSYGLSRLRRVQRVSMWGESGIGNVSKSHHGRGAHGGRGSWAITDDVEARGRLEAGRRERLRTYRDEGSFKEGIADDKGKALAVPAAATPLNRK